MDEELLKEFILRDDVMSLRKGIKEMGGDINRRALTVLAIQCLVNFKTTKKCHAFLVSHPDFYPHFDGGDVERSYASMFCIEPMDRADMDIIKALARHRNFDPNMHFRISEGSTRTSSLLRQALLASNLICVYALMVYYDDRIDFDADESMAVSADVSTKKNENMSHEEFCRQRATIYDDFRTESQHLSSEWNDLHVAMVNYRKNRAWVRDAIGNTLFERMKRNAAKQKTIKERTNDGFENAVNSFFT
jgi:hypothetical protein